MCVDDLFAGFNPIMMDIIDNNKWDYNCNAQLYCAGNLMKSPGSYQFATTEVQCFAYNSKLQNGVITISGGL